MDIKKTLVRMKVSDLVPYERNPRKIPQEAIDDVCESYRQCGVIDPIEIDEQNVILSGHTRRLAALELGLKVIDCLKVEGLTEEQKRKYRILANKTGERSGWDFELLDWELQDLDFEGYDFDLDLSKFEDDTETERKEAKLTDTISVVIECEDEEEAETVFNTLQEEGYKCRISTL